MDWYWIALTAGAIGIMAGYALAPHFQALRRRLRSEPRYSDLSYQAHLLIDCNKGLHENMPHSECLDCNPQPPSPLPSALDTAVQPPSFPRSLRDIETEETTQHES